MALAAAVYKRSWVRDLEVDMAGYKAVASERASTEVRSINLNHQIQSISPSKKLFVFHVADISLGLLKRVAPNVANAASTAGDSRNSTGHSPESVILTRGDVCGGWRSTRDGTELFGQYGRAPGVQGELAKARKVGFIYRLKRQVKADGESGAGECPG
jgi:hypothetical protein